MDTKALRIIVAGGKTSSMTQMITLLDRLGYDVIPAENGAQVLRFLEKAPADLVILDGHLPARDVVPTQERIKKHQHWSNIPVIMMAARHSKTTRNEYIRFGYEGLLTPPFDLQQMHVLIQEYLATGGAKKRKNFRIPFKLPVTVTHRETAQEYQPLNLSEGGIYLQCQQPLPVGTVIDISLPLPQQSPLTLTGMVIYQKGSASEIMKSTLGMAIKFQQPDPLHGVALSHYISGVLLKDLPTGEDSIFSNNRLTAS